MRQWKKTPKRCEQSLRRSPGATDVSIEHIPISWEYSTMYLAILTLEIWLPVKRSYARLPVRSASTWAPPIASSNLLQSSVVDESCHIGALWNENAAGHNCSARSWLSFKLARSWSALIDQYTEPCCYSIIRRFRSFEFCVWNSLVLHQKSQRCHRNRCDYHGDFCTADR